MIRWSGPELSELPHRVAEIDERENAVPRHSAPLAGRIVPTWLSQPVIHLPPGDAGSAGVGGLGSLSVLGIAIEPQEVPATGARGIAGGPGRRGHALDSRRLGHRFGRPSGVRDEGCILKSYLGGSRSEMTTVFVSFAVDAQMTVGQPAPDPATHPPRSRAVEGSPSAQSRPLNPTRLNCDRMYIVSRVEEETLRIRLNARDVDRSRLFRPHDQVPPQRLFHRLRPIFVTRTIGK